MAEQKFLSREKEKVLQLFGFLKYAFLHCWAPANVAALRTLQPAHRPPPDDGTNGSDDAKRLNENAFQVCNWLVPASIKYEARSFSLSATTDDSDFVYFLAFVEQHAENMCGARRFKRIENSNANFPAWWKRKRYSCLIFMIGKFRQNASISFTLKQQRNRRQQRPIRH